MFPSFLFLPPSFSHKNPPPQLPSTPHPSGRWCVLLYGGCDSEHNYSDVQVLEIIDESAQAGGGAAVAGLEERLRKLEEEKERLNRIVDSQHEQITRLKGDNKQRM